MSATTTTVLTPIDLWEASRGLTPKQQRVLLDLASKSEQVACEINDISSQLARATERRQAGQRFGWGDGVLSHQSVADLERYNTQLEGLVQTAQMLEVPLELIQSAYAFGAR